MVTQVVSLLWLRKDASPAIQFGLKCLPCEAGDIDQVFVTLIILKDMLSTKVCSVLLRVEITLNRYFAS